MFVRVHVDYVLLHTKSHVALCLLLFYILAGSKQKNTLTFASSEDSD